MLGIIFLIIYILIMTLISILTEKLIQKSKRFSEMGSRTRIVRCVIYLILALLPVLGAFLPKCDFKYLCMKLGNIWLGIFGFYSMQLLLLMLVGTIVSNIRKDKERKPLIFVPGVAFLLAILLFTYGFIHARSPKTVNYDISVNKETESVKKLRVVLIADLHLSVNSDIKLTEKMVDLVNSADADLVVVAGDIFTSNIEGLKDADKYAEVLRQMKAKYGVYAVYGNHDVDEDLFSGFALSPVSEAYRTPEMEQFFKDAGFNVLYDESVPIADGEITLVGRIDGEKAGDGTRNRSDAKTLLAGVDKSKPVIVVQHEPIDYKNLSENGADVVLSGHTHNGQIFPGNLFIPLFNENGYGVKTIYGMETVVTAGVGYYGPPVRLGTDSEVTVVDITFD